MTVDIPTTGWLVGTTILLTATTSSPGQRTPINVDSITLERIVAPDGTALPSDDLPDFTQDADGYYVIHLDTTGFDPGVYIWVTRAVAGSDVVLRSATFTLIGD